MSSYVEIGEILFQQYTENYNNVYLNHIAFSLVAWKKGALKILVHLACLIVSSLSTSDIELDYLEKVNSLLR